MSLIDIYFFVSDWQLWEIVAWIQEQLEDGTTCITTKYDGFYYTYLVNVEIKVIYSPILHIMCF